MPGVYRKLTIDPPFSIQAGDICPIDFATGTVFQLRGSSVIDQREVTLPGELIGALPPATSTGVFAEVIYFQESTVAGQSVSLVSVQLNQSTGSVTWNFSNGVSREYGSVEDAKSAVQSLDTQSQLAEDALILKTFRRSPDGTNLENMVGAAVSLNFDADVPFVMTYPEE